MQKMIEIKGLSKTYCTGAVEVEALKEIDISIEKGEFVAIMGASGSGKSTFMNVLGCLDTPTSGAYFLDGKEVSTLSGKELAGIRNQKIGFVFQSFNLLPRMNALKNIELPMLYAHVDKSQRKRRAKAAIERVGLAKRWNHKPNEMSGGQKQRVAIARAIVGEPSIILADEPTGNLDSVTSVEIMALFQELNDEGTTIVLVTHEEEIATYAHRVVVFRDGVVINDYRNKRVERGQGNENTA